MTGKSAKAKTLKNGGTSVKRGTNIIAVASGKGGVGKTWFSITLAHALTQMGKRVLLFDGDVVAYRCYIKTDRANKPSVLCD